MVGVDSNQVFVHQTLLASLFSAIEQEILPIRVNDTSLLELFPEIKFHYGKSVESQLYLDLSVANGDFLTINNQTGMQVGIDSPLLAHL
jgi:hypothetical protein